MGAAAGRRGTDANQNGRRMATDETMERPLQNMAGPKGGAQMLFRDITILDETMQPQAHRDVRVTGDRIASIERSTAGRPGENAGVDAAREEIYDGRGKLLMPGFFNAHGHSPMILMRGYGENLSLQSWLDDRIFPFEDKLTGEAVYWATLLAMAESMRFGIVSTTDMYFFPDAMVRAVGDSGMKGNISRGIANFDNDDVQSLPAWQEVVRTFDAYHGSYDGRIRMDFSIHGEYTSNEAGVRAVADLAREKDARVHIHASETRAEHEACKARHGGLTPVAYFHELGLLDQPATVAHCVWIEGEDYDILRDCGATVAVNPISNMKLASGICDVPTLLQAGIRVAIGTDSVASNNSLDFFEEIKAFALASKVSRMDPTAVKPEEALYAATRAGALSQGRTDSGLMRVGAKADLIVVNLSTPNMCPVHSLINNLVYAACGGDVLLTMVDGQVLYENGTYRTIDLARTLYEVQRQTDGILRRLQEA